MPVVLKKKSQGRNTSDYPIPGHRGKRNPQVRERKKPEVQSESWSAAQLGKLPVLQRYPLFQGQKACKGQKEGPPRPNPKKSKKRREVRDRWCSDNKGNLDEHPHKGRTKRVKSGSVKRVTQGLQEMD